MTADKATIIGLSLVIAMSSAAHADTLQNIIDRGEVAIGVKADFAPWGMRDTNGNVVGLEIDLANDLARKLSEQAGKEITARTVVVTTSNRMEFLEQGRIDVLLATMADTPERRRVVGILQPSYYSSGIAVLAKKDSGIDGWESLDGKSICGIQGSWFNKDYGLKNGAEMVVFAGNAEAEAALLAGRCAGWLYDDASFRARLQSNPEKWADYTIATPVVADAPWGAGVRKQDLVAPIAAAVSDAITEWHKSGTIVELEEKWGLGASDWVLQMQEKCLAENPICDSVRDDSE